MADEKKYETLEELADHYTTLKNFNEGFAKDTWDPKLREAFSSFYYGVPQYFAEKGPDIVKKQLIDGSADGKTPGLAKTTKDLTAKTEAEFDKIIEGFNKDQLLTYLITHPGLNAKGESDDYKKIEVYKAIATAHFQAAVKGDPDSMRQLLQTYENSSAIYASGGRDETVRQTYEIVGKVIAETLDKRKDQISESSLRTYIKESVSGLKPEEKAEVLPDFAVLYRKSKKD